MVFSLIKWIVNNFNLIQNHLSFTFVINMSKAILLLGSNLGNKTYYLKKALEYINNNKDLTITKESSVFESKAVGYESKNSYYNLSIEVKTELKPISLLSVCHKVEKELSRTRSLSQRYTDRTIDIDIILVDNLIINTPKLTIPHPRMHERLFCLKPMIEIASEWVVPKYNKTVKELFHLIENTSEVKKVNV